MKTTPRGLRLHIAIFGRRNVGKSSLLNAMTRQSVSIVSEQAGTTTDKVQQVDRNAVEDGVFKIGNVDHSCITCFLSILIRHSDGYGMFSG